MAPASIICPRINTLPENLHPLSTSTDAFVFETLHSRNVASPFKRGHGQKSLHFSRENDPPELPFPSVFPMLKRSLSLWIYKR
ncbi:hypothetical protein VNO80_12321 [Phaseolus coccineus]|uniref:Uncharacterized protein n=1 Tax=Phaseolus coccineus TaxID=3886 RepID=A0AAN9R9B1_PHACN